MKTQTRTNSTDRKFLCTGLISLFNISSDDEEAVDSFNYLLEDINSPLRRVIVVDFKRMTLVAWITP